MKLINYRYGYSNFFDCSLHGKIIVTSTEWEKVKKFLLKTQKWIDDSGYVGFYKKILREDLKRIQKVKSGFRCSIRVSATQGIAEQFGLKKYKRGNYVFEVV